MSFFGLWSALSGIPGFQVLYVGTIARLDMARFLSPCRRRALRQNLDAPSLYGISALTTLERNQTVLRHSSQQMNQQDKALGVANV